MTVRHRVAQFTDGDTADPHGINAEAANLANLLNGGIGRHNVQAGTITGAKVGVNSLSHLTDLQLAAPGTLTFTKPLGQTGRQWSEITDLEVIASTVGGDLELWFSCEATKDPSTARSGVAFALKVDDDYVVMSPTVHNGNAQWTPYLCCRHPVPPGSHRIVPAVMLWSEESATWDVDLDNRGLHVREVIR